MPPDIYAGEVRRHAIAVLAKATPGAPRVKRALVAHISHSGNRILAKVLFYQAFAALSGSPSPIHPT